jgi:hypothetical protein
LDPAFAERWGGRILSRPAIYAELSDAALRRAEDGALPGLGGFEIDRSPFGDDAATDEGLGTIATALRVVAAAASLAGAIASMLMLGWVMRLLLGDRHVLVALGWTRRQLVRVALLVVGPFLLAGALVGAVVGVLASPLAMVGLARRVDPAPRSVLLEAGAIVRVLALAVVALGAAAFVTASRATRGRTPRGSGPVRRLPLRQPIAISVGVRHARFTAVVAAIGGVTAVVAALGVSASIARLQIDPALTGQSSGRVIDSGEAIDIYDRVMPRLESDSRVVSLAGLHVSFDVYGPDGTQLTTLAYDLKRGNLGASIVRGRLPLNPDEVGLGPATLAHLHRRVGERIALRGPHGKAEFRIVAAVLFPEGDFSHDDGVALAVGGADRLLGDTRNVSQLHQVKFDWAPGVDALAADRELRSAGFPVLTNANALEPAVVKNLGQVKALPRYVALFVGLLSLVCLAYTLLVSLRLRSRELSTLRALGGRPSGSAAIVASQGFTVALVALAAGIPLGLLAGREVWKPIATGAHVVVRPVAPWSSVDLLVVMTTAATVALSAIPAWRARQLQPAAVLRNE